MAITIEFKDKQIGKKFSRAMGDAGNRVRAAAREAAHDASRQILARGRADIAGAGRFGPRWTRGLKAPVVSSGADQTIEVSHDVPYFSVFEKGKVIKGKPLLWIPLGFAQDAQGVMARNYPGGLFRVDRKGGKAPLLLSVQTGEPKYFGKSSVRIPKKFHITEIIREVAARMKDFYNARMGR